MTSDLDFLICFDLIRRKSIKKGSVNWLSYIAVKTCHCKFLKAFSIFFCIFYLSIYEELSVAVTCQIFALTAMYDNQFTEPFLIGLL